MTSGVMMQCGGFQFTVDTAAYDRLRRSDLYRWANQERIGAAPQSQAIGRGITTFVLEGRIFPGYNRGGGVVGTYQIERLRAIARTMQPQLLSDGRGNVFGMFKIDQIDEVQTEHLSNGAPRRQEFTVALSSYGDDNFGGSVMSSIWGFLGAGIGAAAASFFG